MKANSGSTAVTMVIRAGVEASISIQRQIPSIFLVARTAHTVYPQESGSIIMELETFGKRDKGS